MNNLYRKLKLSFDPLTPDFPKAVGTYEHCEDVTMFEYDTHTLDYRLLQLIDSCGLSIVKSEIFYNPPHTTVPVHVDTSQFSNMVKLNIHIGSPSCTISWYTPLAKYANKPPKKTQLDTEYLSYDDHEVSLLFNQEVDNISFMNAGLPHGFTNHTDDPSWLLSLAILKDGSNLQFDEALHIFKEYIER